MYTEKVASRRHRRRLEDLTISLCDRVKVESLWKIEKYLRTRVLNLAKNLAKKSKRFEPKPTTFLPAYLNHLDELTDLLSIRQWGILDYLFNLY